MPPEFITAFGTIFVINIIAWLSPGPNMLVIVSAATNQSRRAGFVTALGVGVGGLTWACLALSGVAVLFEVFPNMVFALRLLGAGYLLWLGGKSLLNARRHGTLAVHEPVPSFGTLRTAFKNGFLVMMTNPKAMVYFGSILTAVIPENAPLWFLIAFVMFIFVQSMLQHFITVYVFSTSHVSNWFQSTKQGMQVVFGSLYIALGLGVIYDAYRRL